MPSRPSPGEAARLLLAKFDEEQSVSLKRALSQLLEEQGLGPFEAAVEAEKMAPLVRDLLGQRRPEALPFEFGRSDSMQLVGKARLRSGESVETSFARRARACVDGLHEALLGCTEFDFEVACAAALVMSGASTMFATCSGDDGGVDLYGRLPLHRPDSAVVLGVLRTTLLKKEVLVLGQCKRYDRGARIGRPEVQQFLGSVLDCRRQYDGNPRPPSRRVPTDFYRRDELCIPIFMTTAQYADTSAGEAESNDVILIEGRGLAEFLTRQKVGIVDDIVSGQPIFDQSAFDTWLDKSRLQCRRQP